MISILNKLLAPYLKAAVKKAQTQYRAAPDARATLKLARALSWAGRASDSYSIIAKGRRSFPDSAAIKRAYEVFRNRYARALLRTTLDALKHGATVDSSIRAADLLRTLGQWQRALAILEKARDSFTDNWGLELSVGQIHYNRYTQTAQPSDFNACLKALRRARELNPESYKILFFLGLTCTRCALFGEALSAVDAILSTVPNDQKALALKAHIEKARASGERLEPPDEAPARSSSRPSKKGGADSQVDEAAEKLVARITGQIPETLAAFALSSEGTLLAGETRDTSLFDFADCAEPVAALASSCRNDTDRIGIGTMQSCVMSSDSWQVVVRTVDDMSLVTFLEGTKAAQKVDELTPAEVATQTS